MLYLQREKLTKMKNWLFLTKYLTPKMGSKKTSKHMILKDNLMFFQKIESDFP